MTAGQRHVCDQRESIGRIHPRSSRKAIEEELEKLKTGKVEEKELQKVQNKVKPLLNSPK